MYVDNLAVMARSKQEMQNILWAWKEAFRKHGLKMSMQKTEITWFGQQRKDMNMYRVIGK